MHNSRAVGQALATACISAVFSGVLSPGFLYQEFWLLVCVWHSLIKLTSALHLLWGSVLSDNCSPAATTTQSPQQLGWDSTLSLLQPPREGRSVKRLYSRKGTSLLPKAGNPSIRALPDTCELPYLTRHLTPPGTDIKDPLDTEQKVTLLKHPARQVLPSGSEISDNWEELRTFLPLELQSKTLWSQSQDYGTSPVARLGSQMRTQSLSRSQQDTASVISVLCLLCPS